MAAGDVVHRCTAHYADEPDALHTTLLDSLLEQSCHANVEQTWYLAVDTSQSVCACVGQPVPKNPGSHEAWCNSGSVTRFPVGRSQE